MILGIGVDILHLPRLSQLIAKRGVGPLARRILCARERREFDDVRAGTRAGARAGDEVDVNKDDIRYLSNRWAVKEAAYKALSSTLPNLSWKHLDLFKLPPSPAPSLRLSAEGQEAAMEQDAGEIKMHVSLSHDGEYVVAYVIAERSVR